MVFFNNEVITQAILVTFKNVLCEFVFLAFDSYFTWSASPSPTVEAQYLPTLQRNIFVERQRNLLLERFGHHHRRAYQCKFCVYFWVPKLPLSISVICQTIMDTEQRKTFFKIKLFFFISTNHQDWLCTLDVLQQQLSILENTISVFWVSHLHSQQDFISGDKEIKEKQDQKKIV